MNILVGVYSGMVLGASSFVVVSSLGQSPIVFMTGFASATILSTLFFSWLAIRGYISVVKSCTEVFGRFVDIRSVLTFIQAFNGMLEVGFNSLQPLQRPRVNRVRRQEQPSPPVQANENMQAPLPDSEEEILREDDNEVFISQNRVAEENFEIKEDLSELAEAQNIPYAIIDDEEEN